MKHVGQEIRKYFMTCRITQSSVAELFGYSRPYMSQVLQQARLNPTMADRFVNEYGFNRDFLISGEGELLNPNPIPEYKQEVNIIENSTIAAGDNSQAGSNNNTDNSSVIKQLFAIIESQRNQIESLHTQLDRALRIASNKQS